MKRNQMITLSALLMGVMSCQNNSTSSQNVTPPPQDVKITIEDITAKNTPITGQAGQFSTTITLINNSQSQITNWSFGFYMPRTFTQLQSGLQNINPNLKMQICEGTTNGACGDLIYQQTAITNTDLSAGTTTLLAPSDSFTLQPNTTYTIILKDNNQWGLGNYSAVPQNLFIVVNGVVTNLATNTSTYHLLNYDQSTVSAAIAAHITDNWNNNSYAAPGLNKNIIVPSPVIYATTTSISYSIPDNIIIHNTLSDANTVAKFFQEDLQHDFPGISVSIDNVSNTSGIIIQKTNDAQQKLMLNNPEGYIIDITNDAITISAHTSTGAFYALQSLRQLWNYNRTIQGANILDYPRFKYRGVLLDTSRHFFSVDDVKRLIDIAAIHKLNTLHMHFADDEGTRITFGGYDYAITNKADTRGSTPINSMTALMFVQGNLHENVSTSALPVYNTTYKGTYSSQDIDALKTYANDRSITIIPEIDTPGHARSMIKAFPDILVDPNDLSKYVSVQGYTDDVLPVCTYDTDVSVGGKFTAFMDNLVTDVGAKFSGQNTIYGQGNKEVSLGGDEVSANAWTNDASCGNTSANALEKSHAFFMKVASKHQDIKISGWQQFIQTDGNELGTKIVPSNQVGHVWVWSTTGQPTDTVTAITQAQTLAKNNYHTVMAYADKTYFDVAYTPDITEPGFTWSTPYSDTEGALSSALSAHQTLQGLDDNQQGYIDGIEGTLWSENIANADYMMYMALPKMAGLSEASWSSGLVTVNPIGHNEVNWQNLAQRLGCGNSGFLWYLNHLYKIKYRGEPEGIKKEAPEACLSK